MTVEEIKLESHLGGKLGRIKMLGEEIRIYAEWGAIEGLSAEEPVILSLSSFTVLKSWL